jgi:hypothetical protein
MNNVKRLTAFILVLVMMTVSADLVMASDVLPSNSAIGVIAFIRNKIDRHMSKLQSENGKLLKMLPEELAAADFSEYDTSSVILGTNLFDFNDSVGSVFKYLSKNEIEEEISDGENNIVVLNGSNYKVHSIVGMEGYPDLFSSNMVLKASTGSRVKLISDFPENIPEYQVIKRKKNLYVENIDFYNFSTIKFEYCENIIFNNCTFNDFSANGLVFRGCKNVSVLNCTFKNCGNEITDYTNSGYSIRVVGADDYDTENILIENCTIDNACGNAISFVGKVDNFAIRNNKINNSVWSAIDLWYPEISGNYVNLIENNSCTNVGMGKPSPGDTTALTSGVGCSAIFDGKGSLPKTIVKNNLVKGTVENGIEGAYELVYHNTIQDTGENSAIRYTASTEGIFIAPVEDFEEEYIANDIETRGLRCISSYSDSDSEYNAIYIMGNTFSLKNESPNVICKYQRSDIEINCKRLKKLVISDNTGMRTDDTSVNIYIKDKDYYMDYFDINNQCKIGVVPGHARYCYNIANW